MHRNLALVLVFAYCFGFDVCACVFFLLVFFFSGGGGGGWGGGVVFGFDMCCFSFFKGEGRGVGGWGGSFFTWS